MAPNGPPSSWSRLRALLLVLVIGWPAWGFLGVISWGMVNAPILGLIVLGSFLLLHAAVSALLGLIFSVVAAVVHLALAALLQRAARPA